jgi:hypothetical protein
MHQDTAHYYLVSHTERAVGMEKKIIFRSFKEIQTLLERVRTPLTIEMVDCADFNQQGKSFDDWTESRKESKEIAPESHEGLSNEECFPEEAFVAHLALHNKPSKADVASMDYNPLEALIKGRADDKKKGDS